MDRSPADRARSGQWTRRILDGAAVVAAILIAFALDAWWGERVEGRETGEMLAALESEWASELAKIDETLDVLDRSRRAMLEIIERQSEGAAGLSSDSAVSLMRRAIWSTYKPSLGTTNSILLAELDRIRDPDLRAAIVAWPATLEESAPEQDALHELGDDVLMSELARIAQSTGRGWETDGDNPFLTFGLPAEDLALLAVRDPGFATHLRHVQSVHLSYGGELRQARETLADNLELLRGR